MAIVRKEDEARKSLIGNSYILLDRFIKMTSTIVENKTDEELQELFVTDDPKLKKVRALIEKGFAIGEKFALKAMPTIVDGSVKVGSTDAFLENIISKVTDVKS